MTSAATGERSPRAAALHRRVVLLAWLTIGWNVVEAVVALGAGAAASSTALVGFGLDSTVEVSSAAIVLWQFRAPLPASRERRALRLIAVSFFALAVWVAASAIADLVLRLAPESSPVGIGLAAVSLVVMPALAVAKQRAGRAIRAATVVADSKQTWLCTSLSGVLLVGLTANAVAGWWWADPIAGLVIAAVAAYEGVEAWRGEHCCAPATGCESGAA